MDESVLEYTTPTYPYSPPPPYSTYSSSVLDLTHAHNIAPTMFAQYSYPLHHHNLPPTTPPQSTYFDQASIVHSRPEVADLNFDETDLHATSCSLYPPPPPLPSSSSQLSIPSLVRPLPFPMPSPYAESSRHGRLRSSVEVPTPVLMADEAEFTSRGQMDMGMAEKGSVAAQPGIQTPLATYAAEMVVWLWFGNHQTSPSPYSPSTPSDPFDRYHSPSSAFNPLQVSPSPYFSTFVERMLRITMVSHSVVLVALLYIYRLKMVNNIKAEAGSEQRPFVASLILSNKYLDDNTYTNATWAELAGLTLQEVNKMEEEFLRGMEYKLSVKRADYEHWRTLLDGAILARQREASQLASLRNRPSWSPQTLIFTPNQPAIPTLPEPYRARSASPQIYSPPYMVPHTEYTYTFPPSPHQRKRTAVDAFAADLPGHSAVYEQMRLPVRKAAFNQSIDLTHAQPQSQMQSQSRSTQVTPAPAVSLGRSSSLNRQIAKMPTNVHAQSGRRGSLGHVYGIPTPTATDDSADLRHAAVVGWQNEAHSHEHQAWDGYSALVAPYERPRSQVVPPEHLMFYSLAAEAHPGQDGAPRKAILRYQDPAPYDWPNNTNMHPDPAVTYPTYNNATDGLPQHDQLTYGYTEPEPAQFANAGPPGYAYDPSKVSYPYGDEQYRQEQQQHYHSYPHPLQAAQASLGGLGIQGVEALDHWREQEELRARSQWSSPIPGSHEVGTWSQ